MSYNLSLPEGNPRSANHSSNTWTSSSENPDQPSKEERTDDRQQFVKDYNQLAQQVISLQSLDMPYKTTADP
jgi:hypothetical protein